jgi:glycosyltransferase involved in cell wall biosynthesis
MPPVAGRLRVQRVGMNAVFLQPRMGGLETYVRELVPALLEVDPQLEIRLYVSARGHQALGEEPWASSVALVTHPLLGKPGTRAVAETTVLGWIASRDRLDVLHNVALTAPLATQPLNVVLLGDVTWLRQPQTVGRLRSLLWRTLVLPAARRADRVLTFSEAARAEIAEDSGILADQIDVVPLGRGTETRVDALPEAEVRARFGLGTGQIVLSVSALAPHKNVGALVAAIELLRRSHPDVVLVVPGNPSRHGDELRDQARAAGLEGHVRFPGWVSAGELEGLYMAASAFAFASKREGFGLPVLEAMARGLPVACADASSLPEVAGNAAVYFDPDRPEQIAEALRRLLGDGAFASELVRKGHAQAERFTWTRTAENTLESFERGLAAKKSANG